MTPGDPDTSQTMQRVRVAMTGLAAVALLIVVASVLFNLTARDNPVTAVGAARPEVVANMTDGGTNVASGEPLAELGVVPAPGEANVAAPAGR